MQSFKNWHLRFQKSKNLYLLQRLFINIPGKFLNLLSNVEIKELTEWLSNDE